VRFSTLLLGAALLAPCAPAIAADYPAPKPGDWTASRFTFHTGETLQDLRMHYLTIGDPANPAVLVLHGTARPATGMLTASFAGALFGPGQALDARKYFIVVPDGIGIGDSAKPSDGLRAKFPQYDYADMVQAQYRLVTEGLGLKHLRLVLGNSMGGMQAWLWGETYPDMMDGLVPMASQPAPMSARNWMMRRMQIELVKQDPAYDHGNYTAQPPSLHLASVTFGIAMNGGTLGYDSLAPTRAQADAIIDKRLATPVHIDANDFIYQWAASADYDAMPQLVHIKAPLLAINSADDERNPPDTGKLVAALAQIENARLVLIPASAQSRGHGTTGMARFYATALADFIAHLPPR
jgi:homoserine O-acetyltransferase